MANFDDVEIGDTLKLSSGDFIVDKISSGGCTLFNDVEGFVLAKEVIEKNAILVKLVRKTRYQILKESRHES